MTRTCRICGSADGRYWIETPVEKYAEKTFGQLLVELTRIEVAMAQAEKFPQWLCSACAQKLETTYDFVLQARQTHELWLRKLDDDDSADEMLGSEALEALRETPIHLFEIEGVTIKSEVLEPPKKMGRGVAAADPLVRSRFVKRTIVHFSDSDGGDQDDVPLRQRKVSVSPQPVVSAEEKHNICEVCNKAFRYVTNLYRHKQRDHGLPARPGEEIDDDDNYYKCDQCDKAYKYVMALVKHKHAEHGASLLPAKTSRRKMPGRPSVMPGDGSPSSPASTSGTSTQRSRGNTDALVHSIIKAVELSDEDGNCSADNYYKCNQCSKSYKYIVSLIKHKHREHTDQDKKQSDSEDDLPLASTSAALASAASAAKPSRINRRVEDFDPHSCEPNGAKEIKCMICLRRFTKLRELRDHLHAHPTDFDFEAHGEPIERIAEGFFKTAVESTTEGLKRRIFRDLRLGVYGRYYSITNQARYEMNMDSSDTDSEGEGEEDVVLRRSYACELCDSLEARWPRKYLLHQHHRQEHSWLDAPYVCQRCDSRFLSAQLLEHHTSRLCQNTLKRFQCDKCPQRFFWRRNLRAHLVEHKSKQEYYSCDQCSRSFQDKSAVTKHKLMVHRDGNAQLIPCRWCTRTFYRPSLLYKHVQRHGFTGQDLPLAETLLADASKHTGQKSIQCKVCDTQFISVADLRRHIVMQGGDHSDQPSAYMISTEAGFELLLEDTDESDEESYSASRTYSCDLCDLSFRRRREMSEHQYSLHSFDKLPHSCEHCIFKTVDKSLLDQHLSRQCRNSDKKFICPRCGYKFMWEENLALHLATQHSKQTPTPENQPPSRRKRRFRYQCPHCWRSFVVQPSLEKHIRDMHVAKKNPGKKYLCSLCGLEALTPNKLNIHMRRHMGEKPFKCDLCEMRFTVYYELKVHRRKHTGERPYQCTFCAKEFARPDKLRRHVFMHNAKS